VRSTSLLRRLLSIKGTIVSGVEIEGGLLMVDVRPIWRRPRCSKCGRVHSGYDVLPQRLWRHLDFGGIQVFLRYAVRRVNCPDSGVVVERVPWNDETASRFTLDFEDQVAFLTQRSDKTTVGKLFRIAWETVGTIVERVVRRRRPGNPLEGLEYIGVDELSYRKGHRYLTLVTDLRTGKIVWGKEGKGADALAAFFDELGPEGRALIKIVAMDMGQAYISAAREAVPHAKIVFDRFHVQRLVSDAVDETRREEWRRLRAGPVGVDTDSIKHTRWALLKRSWNLTDSEGERLSALQKNNRRLYRAYLLKETFVETLDRRQVNVVEQRLNHWISWAVRARLPAFSTAAKTIRQHMHGILEYIRSGLSNGVVEGLNTKARLLTRRAYGFHSAGAVIAMIMLCCTGLDLQPVEKIA